MVLLYSQRAYRKICTELSETGGNSEAGGVLIGYFSPFISVVQDITASHSVGRMANVEFVLDGELHTEMAQKVISTYRISPKPLGIWHSHVGTSTEFSTQDRKANQILAQKLNKIFSSIVTGKNDPKIRTWHITSNGCEKVCRTIIPKKGSLNYESK